MTSNSDTEYRLPPRFLKLVTLVAFIALILGIAGVSSADNSQGPYKAGAIVKASMGIFLAVFVIFLVGSLWLYLQLRDNLKVFQKKLFMAIILSCPLLVVRLVYAAISDYTDDLRFAVLIGNPTIYLCMDVLEEIFAMVLTMIYGMSAVLSSDFVKLVGPATSDPQNKVGV